MTQSLASADVLRALVQGFGQPMPASCGYSELVNALVAAAQTVTTIKSFPFQYNTPGLATGYAAYTPTIGEILWDAWIEIDVAWNGTTPKGDVGTFASGTSGLFNTNTGPINMTIADTAPSGNAGLLSSANPGPLSNMAVWAGSNGRQVPAKFTAANPFKVIVTTTGTTAGVDPGATQGSGILYLKSALM